MPCDPSLILLGIYPTDATSAHYRNADSPVWFALLTIAKLGNQSGCPSAGEWIKKAWCMPSGNFNSAIKKEITPFAENWMQLQSI